MRAYKVLLILLISSLLMISSELIHAETAQPIYDDSLATLWHDGSWNSNVDFSNTTPVHSGTSSIEATFTGGYGGIFLYLYQPLSVDPGDKISFWIHGGKSGGQRMRVKLYDGLKNVIGEGSPITARAGSWTHYEFTMKALGANDLITGIVWQDTSGNASTQFYLDDIMLILSKANAPTKTATNTPTTPHTSTSIPSATSTQSISPIATQSATGTVAPTFLPSPTIVPATLLPNAIALSIDVNADRHPISPYIYGMNFADDSLLQELHLPLNRWGGNATTRYNWQVDASNHASDWFYENIPADNDHPETLPAGSSADVFIQKNREANTATLLTIPLIGWTAKSRDVLCGFSVQKYGPQQKTDPDHPDCGNGLDKSGAPLANNDPLDTGLHIDPAFVQDWIRHLNQQFGTADQGGVQFYNLDNEPSLWNSTHRDVFPKPLSYDELRDLTYQYGAVIKAIDPKAQLLGPVEWGWTGYFYSALDQAIPQFWNNPKDRNAHGGTPLVAWYLQQMQDYQQKHGVRILDYLDLHFYPQAAGVTLAPAGDEKTNALRLRSTRSLWDPNYRDESWINDQVKLIPRMRQWVEQNYPGTKLAISEYNWGGLEDINGALTQADILGIFGREGLDMAALWDAPKPDQPGTYAFRLYRNYDGKGSAFGDTSVRSTSADQEKLAIYGAVRADGALTVIVINKATTALNGTIRLNGVNANIAQVYRYSADNLSQIVKSDDQAIQNETLTMTFPASSMTLFVIPTNK